MSALPRIRSWWNAIAHRDDIQQQVEAELEFHIEAQAEELMRRGVPEADALRRARAEAGRPDTQSEKYRNAIGLRIFDELAGDLRYGLRGLLRNPGFAAIAVLSLAIGIGATTAMFSLIYAVLLHPFPYAGASRIMNPVLVNDENPSEVRWFALWMPQFAELGKARSVQSLLGFNQENALLAGKGLPEDVLAVYLTENAGEFFGVHPLLGRMIEPGDAAKGGQPVAVLNYRFWQRHFQGARDVVGKTLNLDNRVYTIVGVMPRRFAFNDTMGVGDVYLPASTMRAVHGRSFVIPWLKLKRGVTGAEASAELNGMVHAFARQNPTHFPRKFHLALQPIVAPYARNTERTLDLLLGGVVVLLLIGCANCSILLLARGAARRHELAVRSALGASRWRIVRQLVVEALVISFAGAALGCAGSWWLAEVPMHLARSSFPAESAIRINLPVLVFSVGVALACGMLLGLAPALRLSRPDLAPAMQSTVRRIAGPTSRGRLNALIAVQTALTFVLLATGAMAIGAFFRITHVPLGYDPHDVLSAGIMTHFHDPAEWARIRSQADRAAYYERIRESMASVPGIVSVGISVDVNPPYGGSQQKVEMPGSSSEGEQDARILEVGRHFFSTLRIPVREGRIWNVAENRRGDGVAVVNQAFAEHWAPHRNLIGKEIRIPGLVAQYPAATASPASSGWRTIVGIAGNIPDNGLGNPVLPAIYVPYTTVMPPYAQYNIRTRGNPLGYMHALRAAVASVAPNQQISRGASTLESVLESDPQWSRQRLFSILFGCFSAMALLLALVGLFSVVSYGVTQRTAEFGVRLALGATQLHIVWVAARAAVLSALAGFGAGVAIDVFLRRIVGQWMHDSTAGIKGLVAAMLVVVICTAGATLAPAIRAASLDVKDTLRYE